MTYIDSDAGLARFDRLSMQAAEAAKAVVRAEAEETVASLEPIAWEPEWPSLVLAPADFGETAGGDSRVQLGIRLQRTAHHNIGPLVEAELGNYDGIQALYDGKQVEVDWIVRLALGIDVHDMSTRVDEVQAIEEAIVAIFEMFERLYEHSLYFAERATAHEAAHAINRHMHPSRAVDMDAVVRILNRSYGIHAYVEQTGGGCATIYAGKLSLNVNFLTDDDAERWDCIAGPGWFQWPGGHAIGEIGDFHVGPDDDGEDIDAVWTAGKDDNEATIAARMADFIQGLD
jgi:hypothetical protein